MKLAAKFTLAFILVMTAVLSVDAYTVFQREREFFRMDMRRDARVLGEALRTAIQRVWQIGNEQTVLDLIRQEDKREPQIRIRWTWLDAPPGDAFAPRAPRDKLIGLAGSSEPTHVEGEEKGVGFVYTYVPLAPGGGRAGALELAESLTELERYTRTTLARIARSTLIIAVATGAAAAFVGVWFVGRPIQRLMESTRQVAAGDFGGRLRIRHHDELGQLAGEVNAMCDKLAEANARAAAESAARLRAVEQLRHADRLRTVGQLTSGIAHELGTPLNVVWARAKMIAHGEVPGDEVPECAGVIVEQAARMTKIIRQLLDFARPRSPKKAQIDLFQTVRQTLALLEPIAKKGGVSFILAGGETPVFAQVDSDQLQQVLSNLVLNAVQAMQNGGPVTIGIERRRVRPPADHPGADDEYLAVYVRDQGQGIKETDLPRVFEPFYTTKDVGEGTGLGLSVALGMIREHGGWIDVESRPGAGACFTVYLPVT